LKYFVSFRTTLKVSRYLFRALALLLWLLIALFSVFYIVNALHEKESEIRQEFNLSYEQAQRYIQRTSDVMKELKYIAENRLTVENGVLPGAARTTIASAFPNSSRCSPIPTAQCSVIPGATHCSRWPGSCVTGAITFPRLTI
jgi:two-component system capsular synthesis sensor histidine kinase RcsC